jgi:DNA-binding HxlR family transcriptional regulator
LAAVPRRSALLPRRSGCPVSIALDVLGDRWSLLVIRDLMVRGVDTFTAFQRAGEGIATNILADRLQRLERAGIVRRATRPGDGRRVHYRLTEKGIDLAPVLIELLLWSARHEDTGAPDAVMTHVAAHRDAFLEEARRRWREGDATPLLPRFEASEQPRASRRAPPPAAGPARRRPRGHGRTITERSRS